MIGRIKNFLITLSACILVVALIVALNSYLTERDISTFEERIADLGVQQQTSSALSTLSINGMPEPVQRYLRFTFPDGVPSYGVVRVSASGEFRRPLTQSFNPTTARQVIATREPALMFSATTPIVPGIWARAYDYFAKGEMEMKAKILSTITVVNEKQTPKLNEISLRRWLLESPLYPTALLPGGPVSWEALNQDSARAVVIWGGMRASMLVYFAPDGSITHMQAESDGDLSTPYHGSGEHVVRSNYRQAGQQMIPMDFTISRMAAGKIYPFWKGHISQITFE